MAHPRFRPYFRHGLLPQLIAFEACLRLGGVTRAAEELSLAQPTVSGLLRRLSETIGEPVLRTKGGRVELTRTGRDVALLCQEIFESLDRFDQKRALQSAHTPPLAAQRLQVARSRFSRGNSVHTPRRACALASSIPR